jgi:hypothetical protein
LNQRWERGGGREEGLVAFVSFLFLFFFFFFFCLLCSRSFQPCAIELDPDIGHTTGTANMPISAPRTPPLSFSPTSKLPAAPPLQKKHREPVAYPSIPPIYSLLLTLPSITSPFLPPSILAAYPNAVQSLLPSLDPVDAHLRELLPRSQNWTHELLTTLLLSARGPLAAEAKLAYLLAPLGAAKDRTESAARLLWAVGYWRTSGYGGAKKEELGWMTDGLLGAYRTPGRECDDIRLADGEMREAIVWAGGRAWGVEVVRAGEVLGVEEIKAQVEAIISAAEAMVWLAPFSATRC